MVLASRLSIHLKIHSGVKSHLCDLCGRAFLLKAYLNAHIRINHRGTERPKRFMCSSCGYTCDQKHKLEVHERVHTDERVKMMQSCVWSAKFLFPNLWFLAIRLSILWQKIPWKGYPCSTHSVSLFCSLFGVVIKKFRYKL